MSVALAKKVLISRGDDSDDDAAVVDGETAMTISATASTPKEKLKTRPYTRCANLSCNALNYFEHLDPIKCSTCGYRVVYKERPRIPRQYLCR